MYPGTHGVETKCRATLEESTDQFGASHADRDGGAGERRSTSSCFNDFPLVPASEFEVIASIDEVTIADFDEIFRSSRRGSNSSRVDGLSLEELRRKKNIGKKWKRLLETLVWERDYG
jgi:hypothetical protein